MDRTALILLLFFVLLVLAIACLLWLEFNWKIRTKLIFIPPLALLIAITCTITLVITEPLILYVWLPH